MYPYYWNGYNVFSYSVPFAANVAGLVNREMNEDDDLPDEVKEALENHKNEIHNVHEREEFLDRLDKLK